MNGLKKDSNFFATVERRKGRATAHFSFLNSDPSDSHWWRKGAIMHVDKSESWAKRIGSCAQHGVFELSVSRFKRSSLTSSVDQWNQSYWSMLPPLAPRRARYSWLLSRLLSLLSFCTLLIFRLPRQPFGLRVIANRSENCVFSNSVPKFRAVLRRIIPLEVKINCSFFGRLYVFVRPDKNVN